MFKTRTSNISNPDRKEKVCQPWAMVFDCQWKNMEIMAGTIHLIFCNVYNARTSFSKYTNELFNVQGSWHPSDGLLTMAKNRLFIL